MSASLVPCPSCSRHVRVSDARCPFCASALPTSLAQKAIPGTTQRLTRAAAFAFTASLAVAGCSSDPSPDAGTTTDVPAVTDTPSPTDRPDVQTPVDSGSPTDAARPDSGTPDDTGGVMPLYGAPVDAGPPPADVVGDDVVDAGGIAPLYGLPPADGGGVRYGAPPPPDAAF